jgi:hypothetical protein
MLADDHAAEIVVFSGNFLIALIIQSLGEAVTLTASMAWIRRVTSTS